MHRLVLATHNSHKTREFAEILGKDFEVRDLTDLPGMPDVAETGATFEENAILKAVSASQHCSELIVADDSGLEVDALQGAPGIYSARYAGAQATDAENIAKLLAALSPHSPPYSARFRCSVVLARDGEVLNTFNGVIEGTIVNVPRGDAGFGYDPVFQPAGFEQTFGELSPVEKNKVSHRARAIQSLRNHLLEP